MLLSFRLILGLLPLAAIGVQFAINIEAGLGVVNFFSFFTNLSNLLSAGVMLWGAYRLARGRRPTALYDQMRLMAVLNMVIVGVVFAVLLRNADLGSLRPWVNTVVHTIAPIGVVIEWIVEPPASPLGWRQIFRCLIFPGAYLAYVMTRGSLIGWYPYPFLRPASAGGLAGVAGYALGIAATFLCAAWLLIRVGIRGLSFTPR